MTHKETKDTDTKSVFIINNENAEIIGIALREINNILNQLNSVQILTTHQTLDIKESIEEMIREFAGNPVTQAEAEEYEYSMTLINKFYV